ncbi:hypothetical protein OG196_14610 [Kitasatospora purpeofusca]|uniref:hypothetical protein n=1 Tax=Kitasatospora purpeofusca TaxID=67352 RepID=UPI002E13FC2F|nr:hypothetical protein OG196_14610 [Kitasatospora purpeofusca]
MGKHPRRRDRSDKGAADEHQPDAVPIVEFKDSGRRFASKRLLLGSSSRGKTDMAAFVTAALGPGGRRSFQLPGITSTPLPTLEGPRAREVRRAQASSDRRAPTGFDAAAVVDRMDAAGAGEAPVPTQDIVDTVRSAREGAE